jgi:AAA domain
MIETAEEQKLSFAELCTARGLDYKQECLRHAYQTTEPSQKLIAAIDAALSVFKKYWRGGPGWINRLPLWMQDEHLGPSYAGMWRHRSVLGTIKALREADPDHPRYEELASRFVDAESEFYGYTSVDPSIQKTYRELLKLATLTQGEIERGIEPLDFETVDEVEANTPPMSFIVEDLIMRGGTTLLIGPPKKGKSTLSKQIALHVAKGLPVLNREVKQGKVLYMQLEEYRTWTTDTLRRMGFTAGDPVLLSFKRPESGKAVDTLRATLRAHPDAVLLVLDMMGKVLQINDYNDYGEVTEKLEPITNLARETNVSILLLHHGKKDGTGDVVKDALGSTALTGNVDIIAGMTMDAALPNTNYLTTSSRVGPSLSPVTLDWNPGTHLYSIGTSRADVWKDRQRERKEASLRQKQERIIEVLKLHPEGISRRGLRAEVGGKWDSMEEALTPLTMAGRVSEGKQGLALADSAPVSTA